jgi:hypothetical protein
MESFKNLKFWLSKWELSDFIEEEANKWKKNGLVLNKIAYEGKEWHIGVFITLRFIKGIAIFIDEAGEACLSIESLIVDKESRRKERIATEERVTICAIPILVKDGNILPYGQKEVFKSYFRNTMTDMVAEKILQGPIKQKD